MSFKYLTLQQICCSEDTLFGLDSNGDVYYYSNSLANSSKKDGWRELSMMWLDEDGYPLEDDADNSQMS